MKPTVCGVMLVNGRAQMVKRAIQCFRAQTYEPKRLIILDTGTTPLDLERYPGIWEESAYMPEWAGETIGCLRNKANSIAWENGICDTFAHFDSDDWSHPRRLEEQVALLEASGKQCVGFRGCLFWDTRQRDDMPGGYRYNEAWLYRQDEPRYAIGASFMYCRELWEKHPFPDAPHEDRRWWLTPEVSNNCVGVSSLMPMEDPRMVCQIHGANTEAYKRSDMLAGGGGVWKRAVEFDSYCASKMQ